MCKIPHATAVAATVPVVVVAAVVESCAIVAIAFVDTVVVAAAIAIGFPYWTRQYCTYT